MYEEGQALALRTEATASPLEARIHALPMEFSLSAVRVVDVSCSPDGVSLPSKAFLKLYDWRCAKEYHGKK